MSPLPLRSLTSDIEKLTLYTSTDSDTDSPETEVDAAAKKRALAKRRASEKKDHHWACQEQERMRMRQMEPLTTERD